MLRHETIVPQAKLCPVREYSDAAQGMAWDVVSHASMTIDLHQCSPPAVRDTSRDTSEPFSGSSGRHSVAGGARIVRQPRRRDPDG